MIPSKYSKPETMFVPIGDSGITVRGLTIIDTISINTRHGVATDEQGFAMIKASMIAHACDEVDSEAAALAFTPSTTEAVMSAIIKLTQTTLSSADSAIALAIVKNSAPETAH